MAWANRFNDFVGQDFFKNGLRGGRTNKTMDKLESKNNYGTGQKTINRAINGCVPTSFEHQFRSSPRQNNGNCDINDISTRLQSVSIAGVIIARTGPKQIISKKGKERHLITLVVCDAPLSFIHVSCWGSLEYANQINSFTSIGDVVEIKECQVQAKSSPTDDKFKPWTPGPCQLSVSENHGSVLPNSNHNVSDLALLVCLPPRESHDFYTLDRIQTSGMNCQEQHVNLMVVVKKIWPRKVITTKQGKTTSKIDVVVFDQTCLTFDLTLWDSHVDIAESWIPMETIIFATDLKIVFSEFKSTMVAFTDSKTIFTCNPDTPEANDLNEFKKTQTSHLSIAVSHLETFDSNGPDPDVNMVTNELTILNVKEILADPIYHGNTVYGVVYACLTSFDVDGDDELCMRNVCTTCRKMVYKGGGFVCSNPKCGGGDPMDKSGTGLEYNISVCLSDQTGSLNFCNVHAPLAKELIGYEAVEFTALSLSQRTAIKWKFLFERVRTVLKIRSGTGRGGMNSVKVLALSKMLADDPESNRM